MDTLQKGAIGAEIVAQFLDVDLSLASAVLLYFRKSNKVKIGPFSATVFTDTDSVVKAKYVTPDADFLDRAGVWSVQGYIDFPAGFSGPSEVGQFEVLGNIF